MNEPPASPAVHTRGTTGPPLRRATAYAFNIYCIANFHLASGLHLIDAGVHTADIQLRQGPLPLPVRDGGGGEIISTSQVRGWGGGRDGGDPVTPTPGSATQRCGGTGPVSRKPGFTQNRGISPPHTNDGRCRRHDRRRRYMLPHSQGEKEPVFHSVG